MTPVANLRTVEPETTITGLLDQMFPQRHVGSPTVENSGFGGMVTLADISEVQPVERERTARPIRAFAVSLHSAGL